MRKAAQLSESPRRLPCRSGKAVYWRAAPPLGHATTFAAARWRRAYRGPRRGTSSCRYRCRLRRSQYWVSETWRAPCLWRPLPASVAGGAGARPDHPITGSHLVDEFLSAVVTLAHLRSHVHRFRDAVGALDKSFHQRAQASILQRNDRDRPWACGEIERQRLERETRGVKVQHRSRQCRDEIAVRDEIGSQVNG